MNVKGNFYNSPQKPIVTDEGGLADLLSHNALPIRLATGFKIAQGPAAAKNGDVYFSDIFHDKIFKWSFGDEQLSLFRNQPGGPDGLYFEKDGSLLVCELTGKRFARLSTNGQYEIIAEEFEGTSLTGANDVYVDNQGGIYFSDSFPGSVLRGPKFCVYYIAPGQNSLKKIIDDHYKTKGIHISEDGKWIYIADFGGRKVYRYELKSPGVLGKKELFIDTRCGGLTVDEYGNVYISTVGDHGGVLVFDLDGKKLGKIMFPENTTNVTFAGPNRDKLLITTFKSIYSLDMNVKGLGNNYKTE
jgi:gluconolactonase